MSAMHIITVVITVVLCVMGSVYVTFGICMMRTGRFHFMVPGYKGLKESFKSTLDLNSASRFCGKYIVFTGLMIILYGLSQLPPIASGVYTHFVTFSFVIFTAGTGRLLERYITESNPALRMLFTNLKEHSSVCESF